MPGTSAPSPTHSSHVSVRSPRRVGPGDTETSLPMYAVAYRVGLAARANVSPADTARARPSSRRVCQHGGLGPLRAAWLRLTEKRNIDRRQAAAAGRDEPGRLGGAG